jgi:plasmid maintenance system antidote protein VapI
MIKEHLYTPGELLRSQELEPDTKSATELAKQLNLFSTGRS